MSRKRSHSPDLEPASTQDTKYFKSNKLEDRDSTFVGIFSSILSAKELQKLPDFKSASHRMIGWRKPSTQRTLNAHTAATDKVIYLAGSDDDGEKYGGKRLEKVLNELNVEGSVMVVRWYGGTLLGPVRFTHIENVAREAILLWKDVMAPANKKAKTESPPDSDQKDQLIRALEERDRSITVLRQLLADKASSKDNIKGVDTSVNSGRPASQSPNKTPQYTNMSLAQLKQLDKARDASIAWILKQLDAAETQASIRNARPV